MPAKKSKPAAKKTAAKPAKKAPSKPVGKPKSKPAPAKKPASKKPAPKPVKKAPAKPAPKKAAPAKKPAAKPAPQKAAPPAKKAAPAKKPAAPAKKAPAPAPAKVVKPAPAPKAPEKKAAPAPVPAPAPAPVKAVKPSKSSSKSTVTIPKGKVTISGPRTGTPRGRQAEEEGATIELATGPVKMTPFLKKQKQRLIELRDAYLNSIEGVASETMGGGDSSAFGMHQADAGSDAYDRDFALSLLGKEQDALYEINEALKRIENGTYGICEGTGERIMEERLEAMPFARYGIKWQEKIEREGRRNTWNRPVHSLFGLDDGADDDKDDDKDDEETTTTTSNSNNSGESLDFSKE